MPTTTLQTADTGQLVIGVEELAAVLGKPQQYLKRNWLKLHQTLGMPRKHAAGWVWPRAAINVWLTSQAACSAPTVDAVPGNDNTGDLPPDLHGQRVEEQRAALHQLLGVRT